MIETILIFPLIASLFLFLIKSKKLNNLVLIGYSIILLYNSIMIYSKLTGTGKLPHNLFGAYFNVDSLNILFLLVLAIIFTGVAIYNQGFVKKLEIHKNRHTYYSIGILLFIFSMAGVILSANLALSWVFIEATTLASAYLIYFNKTKHSLEATWKYVFICSIGIALAFVGIILLSIGMGKVNSLFFNELYLNAGKISPFWLKLSFVFILIGFGTKMGLAPVHAWLPDAHAEAPSPVSALLSATLLNSAFLIILRVYKLMELTNLDHYARILLISMGILSLCITAIFVFNINNYKRMLAYSSIENMGIIAIGIAVGGLGIYAAMLHLIAHSLIKSSFFLTAGNVFKLFKTKKIDEINGILKLDKITGWLWVVCFLGIIGLPPSPIFISEFLLIKAMFAKNQIALIIVFSILLTIIMYGIARSVIKMSFGSLRSRNADCSQRLDDRSSWSGMLFNAGNQGTEPKHYLTLKNISWSMYVPQVIFITISLVLGIYMPPFINQLLKNAVLAISSM